MKRILQMKIMYLSIVFLVALVFYFGGSITGHATYEQCDHYYKKWGDQEWFMEWRWFESECGDHINFSRCGNGVIDTGEDCDTDEVMECAKIGFSAGTMTCTKNCQLNTSSCIWNGSPGEWGSCKEIEDKVMGCEDYLEQLTDNYWDSYEELGDCDEDVDEAEDILEDCLEDFECIDSDGGSNYYIQGTTVGRWIDSPEMGIVTKEDFCLEGEFTNLQEFSCETVNNKSGIVQWGYNCTYGCQDGACVEGDEIFYSNVTDCYLEDDRIIFIRDSEIYNFSEYYCMTGSALGRWYCDLPNVKREIIECEGKCEDDECVEEGIDLALSMIHVVETYYYRNEKYEVIIAPEIINLTNITTTEYNLSIILDGEVQGNLYNRIHTGSPKNDTYHLNLAPGHHNITVQIETYSDINLNNNNNTLQYELNLDDFECYDTSNGHDRYTFGRITIMRNGEIYSSHEDSCGGEYRLQEYWCENKGIGTDSVLCNYGCILDACLEDEQIPTEVEVDRCNWLNWNITYKLINDIISDDGICFHMTDNSILDGDGYSIRSTNTNSISGIYTSYKDNITIRNVNIENFRYGIGMIESNNSTISNNSIIARYSGIKIEKNSGIVIENNSISLSDNGIYILDSDNVTLNKNTVCDSDDFDLKCINLEFSSFSENTCDTIQGCGIDNCTYSCGD